MEQALVERVWLDWVGLRSAELGWDSSDRTAGIGWGRVGWNWDGLGWDGMG